MNAGRVELDIVAMGKDQVSATLAKVDAKLRETKQQMDGVAASTTKVSAATASMGARVGDSIKPIDKARELFEKVNSNIGFLTTGLIGVGAALVGFLADLLETERQLSKTAQGFVDGSREAAKMTTELGRISSAASQASKSVQGFEVRIAQLGAQIARTQGNTELAAEFEKQATLAATRGAIKASESAMNAADKAANEAQARLSEATKKQKELLYDVQSLSFVIKDTEARSGLVNVRAREELATAAAQLAGVTTNVELARSAFDAASKAASAFAEELVFQDALESAQQQATAQPAGGGRGGGRGSAAAPRLPQFVAAAESPAARQLRDIRALAPSATQALDELNTRLAEQDAFRFMAEDVAEVSSELERMVALLDRAAQEALPDVADGLSEAMRAFAKYAEITGKLNEQVLAGTLTAAAAEQQASDARVQSIIAIGGATVAGVAKQLGGLRPYWAAKALESTAAAAFAGASGDLAGVLGYTTAAIAYGALAGGASGGGGARASGSGGGTRSGSGNVQSSSGPTTVVYNFSSLVTDRQQVGRALAEVAARGQRSGYARRRGA